MASSPSTSHGGSPPAFDGVIAYLAGGTNVDVASGTIPWDTALIDTGGYLDPATGLISIPAGKLGLWRIETVLRTGAGAFPGMALEAYFDGAQVDSLFVQMSLSASLFTGCASKLLLVDAPDVWRMTLRASSGTGDTTVSGTRPGSQVAMTYLGPAPS